MTISTAGKTQREITVEANRRARLAYALRSEGQKLREIGAELGVCARRAWALAEKGKYLQKCEIEHVR